MTSAPSTVQVAQDELTATRPDKTPQFASDGETKPFSKYPRNTAVMHPQHAAIVVEAKALERDSGEEEVDAMTIPYQPIQIAIVPTL
jgi:hypothetical protein